MSWPADGLSASQLPVPVRAGQVTGFAASAVIVNDRNQIFLLMRDDYPVWVNIGGVVDDGESFETALRREVREETGLEVDIIRQGGDYFSATDTGEATYRHERLYLCRPRGDAVAALGNDGILLRWFDQNSLPLNIPPRHRIRIEETLQGTAVLPRILTATAMRDFCDTLPAEHIHAREDWLAHPKVRAKNSARLRP